MGYLRLPVIRKQLGVPGKAFKEEAFEEAQSVPYNVELYLEALVVGSVFLFCVEWMRGDTALLPEGEY